MSSPLPRTLNWELVTRRSRDNGDSFPGDDGGVLVAIMGSDAILPSGQAVLGPHPINSAMQF